MEGNSQNRQDPNMTLWGKLQSKLWDFYASDLAPNRICWSYICILAGRYVKSNDQLVLNIPTSAYSPLRHLHYVWYCKCLLFLQSKHRPAYCTLFEHFTALRTSGKWLKMSISIYGYVYFLLPGVRSSYKCSQKLYLAIRHVFAQC